jgi:hypothetical protein
VADPVSAIVPMNTEFKAFVLSVADPFSATALLRIAVVVVVSDAAPLSATFPV